MGPLGEISVTLGCGMFHSMGVPPGGDMYSAYVLANYCVNSGTRVLRLHESQQKFNARFIHEISICSLVADLTDQASYKI